MKSGKSSARLDTRLSAEHKELFLRAASLGGFKTLTEFVLFSARQQAEKIVRQHASWLASEQDRKIFFDALVNPPVPNRELKQAAKKYKETTRR
jgi:uncharacterized protein (DUF1778 family)